MEWENISANYVSDEGLKSKIQKFTCSLTGAFRQCLHDQEHFLHVTSDVKLSNIEEDEADTFEPNLQIEFTV